MCTAAGHNFGTLSVLRILLGSFEAAINPGFTMITAMWYKPSEHALRHGIWYGGASIAYIFGGVLAYGFSHINSAVKSWQVRFMVLRSFQPACLLFEVSLHHLWCGYNHLGDCDVFFATQQPPVGEVPHRRRKKFGIRSSTRHATLSRHPKMEQCTIQGSLN